MYLISGKVGFFNTYGIILIYFSLIEEMTSLHSPTLKLNYLAVHPVSVPS